MGELTLEVLLVGIACGFVLGVVVDRLLIAMVDARNRLARRNGR
jgi:high-affinity Fe2+/Pb2+ permease